ncbi:MAG TPA: hypothetical protein VIT38_14920 [Allosphingosinicella sp.]|jgi:outer membrane murein-binding lipoprotein Lpp
MRYLTITAIAGAALALAACGDNNPVNNAASNELDANMTMEAPANDASAMEATTNATDTAPVVANETGNTTGGETSGGDTGGNNVESNVSGM